jgi:Transposase
MDHIGIDLHKKESQICILRAEGELIEQRIRTTPARFADVLGDRPRARILLEASTESEWVARCLEGFGHEVIVADPNFAPMYAARSRKIKTDRRDARALAEACRLGAEGCTNPGSCRGLVVFVQQTAQEVPPTHVRLHRRGHRLTGSLRRGQLEPPMWPFGIVVVDVDSEHALEMPLIQDEEPVQALGPHRPDPAFRVRIRAGRLHRRADHLAGRAAEDLIKGPRELAVPITHEEPAATVELWALEN